jgi:hypothetical protein
LDKEVTSEVMSINPRWMMVPLFSNNITRRIEKSVLRKAFVDEKKPFLRPSPEVTFLSLSMIRTSSRSPSRQVS